MHELLPNLRKFHLLTPPTNSSQLIKAFYATKGVFVLVKLTIGDNNYLKNCMIHFKGATLA
jgi:hypothetical protein